jgi:uncharacterized protein
MKKQIFINLPVTDLKKSMDFYTQIGFVNNPQFTDETAACMVLSDEIYVMLLTHNKFSQFTQKKIADTQTTVAVINSLALAGNGEVDAFMENALKAGGVEPNPPRDYGFMYQRSVEDTDGHLWEVFFMDMSKVPQS